jgi:hypothetical protein
MMKAAFAIECNFAEYVQDLDSQGDDYEKDDADSLHYGEMNGVPAIIKIQEYESEEALEEEREKIAAKYNMLPESIMVYYLDPNRS